MKKLLILMFLLTSVFVNTSDDKKKELNNLYRERDNIINLLSRPAGYITPFIVNERRQVLLALGQNSDKWINGSQQYGHDYQNSNINSNICSMMEESTGINISEVNFAKKINGVHGNILNHTIIEPCWYYVFVAKGCFQQARLLRPDAYQEQLWFDVDNLPHNMLLDRYQLSQALKENL